MSHGANYRDVRNSKGKYRLPRYSRNVLRSDVTSKPDTTRVTPGIPAREQSKKGPKQAAPGVIYGHRSGEHITCRSAASKNRRQGGKTQKTRGDTRPHVEVRYKPGDMARLARLVAAGHLRLSEVARLVETPMSKLTPAQRRRMATLLAAARR